MISLAVSQGRLVTVIALIVCVLGLAATVRMPVQMIPDLDTRIIVIETGWPGATPQDVEKEILLEQERYLRGLPNLIRMESYAFMGGAEVVLEFPFGIDVNDALLRVANALSQVPGYPENVDQPRLSSESFSQNAFLYFSITPTDGNPRQLDMDMVTDFIDNNVRPRMERVAGVSQVELRGGALRQIQIRIDPQRLAQRQLTLDDISGAIRARNQDVSAGDINSGKRRYLIRTRGRFPTAESLASLIIDHRDGHFIRLGDVAEISTDHYEKRNSSVMNGEPSIMLAVKRQQDSNVIDIKTAMLAETAALERDLLKPNGLKITLTGDDVRYVQSSVNNVFFNLCLGAILGDARDVSISALGSCNIYLLTWHTRLHDRRIYQPRHFRSNN